MTPETELNINQAIEWLQSTGTSVRNFTSEQAPLYCQELLRWELWGSLTQLVLGVALLILTAVLARTAYRRDQEGYYDIMGYIIFSVPLLAAGLVLTIFSVMDIGKVLVAPRLVIVEHFKALSK